MPINFLHDVDITGDLTISDDVSVGGDLTTTGTTYGIYHSYLEDSYYHDNYNGSRNLAIFFKNARADLIRYQPVDNFEYWNGSAWVADASQESNVEKLLDGRQDTSWSVPSTYYKFRFTTNTTTGWPTQAMIWMQTSWSGSTYPGATMLVEETADATASPVVWVTKVTADFTSSNGNTNWGLHARADGAIHTGNGDGANETRITIDFYGWSPSNSSYTTIPLQNLMITSNYAGTENTDYTNLLNYNRQLTTRGSILPHSNNLYDIGTSSKKFKDLYLQGDITVGNSYNTIYKDNGFTFTDNQDYNIISGSTKILDLHFNEQKYYISNTEKMRLNSTGLGIGTTSPASLLHIYEDSSTSGTGVGLTIENDGTGDAIAQFLLTGSKRWVMGIDNSDSNKFKIADSADLNTDALFTIDGDGNVGIGTTTPSQKLEVNGYIAATRFINPSSTLSYLQFDSQDMKLRGTALIYLSQAGSEQFRIQDGKVGIGTSTPGQELDVDGNIRTNSSLYVYNSDLSKQTFKVRAESSTNSGLLKLSNGSNWGLLMKGYSNGPYIGSYYGGNLSITGFESSDGATPSATKLDTFNFGGTGGADGYLSLNGDLKVNSNKKIQLAYGNSQTNGIEWTATKISAAITPVDTANYSRTGLGFFTGDFSDTTTDAAERMRITRAGNVGIGTTSPSELLHVYSSADDDPSIKLENARAGGDGSLLLQHRGSSITIDSTDSDDINFKMGGGDIVQFASDGNVGIGTSSPLGLLQLDDYTVASQGNNTANGVASIFTDSGDDALYLGIKNHAYPNRGYGFKTTTNGVNADFTIFEKGLNGDRFTITTGGNVGIGTTAPAYALHINKDNPYIQIQDSSASTRATMSAGILMNDSTGASSFGITQSNSADVLIRANAGDLSLGTFAGTIIKLDGANVGIGTTSPASKLDVNGTITLNGDTEHQILRSTSSSWGLGGADTTFIYGRNVMLNSYDDIVLRAGTSDEIRMYAGNDSTARLTIANDGNIAVSGTVDGRDLASDGSKLDTIDTNADVTPTWVPTSDPSYLTGTETIVAPASITLSIVSDTINVTFAASTTSNIDNYLVFSSVDGGDYGLISIIPPEDIASSMSIIDNSFDVAGTQAYRVYAVKNGNYSSPRTGSISFSAGTVEVYNLNVVNLNKAFYIQWDPPSNNSRFVTAYNLYKHEAAATGDLSEASATLIYSGMNTNYMYSISGATNDNYHKFWVTTTIA